jgi:hypothetical protein
MLMTSVVSRSALLAAVVLVLLAATPLFAAGPAAPAAPTATPAPSGGCTPTAGPFADLLAAGFPNVPGKALAGPACKVEASTTISCTPGVNCHGYCACECSTRKDCNVNSDCSNRRCLSGISCC